MVKVRLNIKRVKTNLPFDGESQILYDESKINCKLENKMSMKLPELDRPLMNLHVDATPDGKYAIRILKCYLERARVKFIIEDNDELFVFMNECQDKRVKELTEAIDILEGRK